MRKSILRFLALSSAGLVLIAQSVSATTIEYTLDPDWEFEAEQPTTLSLSDNPTYGIDIDINLPTGLEEGGLSASRHDLPGFSLDQDGFIELRYGDYVSDAVGTTDAEIHLELEFYDDTNNFYELGITHNGSTYASWFQSWSADLGLGTNGTLPDGLLMDEGALGFIWEGDDLTAYFRGTDDITTDLAFWDISGISGAHSFGVDNDFEAHTFFGGTIEASVNFKEVIYGEGSPTAVPEPSSLPLMLMGIMALVFRRLSRII